MRSRNITPENINYNLYNEAARSSGFVGIFLFNMPTLKEFLESNNIKATPDQRSRLGRVISSPNDNNGLVLEDGFTVKDYKDQFLNKKSTQTAIIEYLSKTMQRQ